MGKNIAYFPHPMVFPNSNMQKLCKRLNIFAHFAYTMTSVFNSLQCLQF